VEYPCLSFVTSRPSAAPTISKLMRAALMPPAIVAITTSSRPPIMMAVPSMPRPAMPAEAGLRQLP